MDPADLIAFLLRNWKLLILGALIAALGVQTYRLQGAQGEVRVFKERANAQEREQAARESFNHALQEVTDEDYAAALRRARALPKLRVQPTIVTNKEVDTGGDQDSTECISRGELRTRLADVAEQHARRLSEVAAAVSQRHSEGLEQLAQRGEEVAAAYRACRSFSLNVE